MNLLKGLDKNVWLIIFKYLTDIRDFSSLALTSKWLLKIARNDHWVATFNWSLKMTTNNIRVRVFKSYCLKTNIFNRYYRFKPHYKRNEVREGVSYRQAMGSTTFYFCRRVPTIAPSPKKVNTAKIMCEISYSRLPKKIKKL